MCYYTSIQTKIAYHRYTFIIKANTRTNKRTNAKNETNEANEANNGYATSQGVGGYADGYSTSQGVGEGEADRKIDS